MGFSLYEGSVYSTVQTYNAFGNFPNIFNSFLETLKAHNSFYGALGIPSYVSSGLFVKKIHKTMVYKCLI